MATKRIHTPLWIRVWHWTVAVLYLILVFTGVVLTFSGSQFAMMNYELANSLHDVTGIGLAAVYVLFLVIAVATGYWQNYVRRWRGLLERMGRQSDRAMRSLADTPSQTPIGQRRLDRLQPLLLRFQQLLYLTSITILLPLLIVTGLLYLYPETAPREVLGFAGLWTIALAHYVVGLFGTIFLLFHIYISTVAGLRRMISGREARIRAA